MRLEVSDTFAAPASPPDDEFVLSDAAARDEVETTCAETNIRIRTSRARRATASTPKPARVFRPPSRPDPRARRSGRRGARFPRARDFPKRASLGSAPRPVPSPSPSPSGSGSAVAAHLRERLRAMKARAARAESSLRDARESAASLAGDVAAYRERVSSLARGSRGGGERARRRGIVGEGRERSRDRLGDARGARRDGVGGVSTVARRAMRRVAQSRRGSRDTGDWRIRSAWRPNRRGGRRSSGRDARPTVATTRYVASSTPRPPRPREVSSPCPRFSRGTRARRTTPGAIRATESSAPRIRHPAEPRGAWTPKTLADAIEVEVALRTMTAMRVEEAVLVALADRGRALADRRSRGDERRRRRRARFRGFDSPPRRRLRWRTDARGCVTRGSAPEPRAWNPDWRR